jgi:transcriptional regulator with XRE-family HTH domain
MSKKKQECVAFGLRVRQFRNRRGYSQELLADKTGIHRTYIGGIERGERNPTLLMIHRIADALRTSPAQLLADNEE